MAITRITADTDIKEGQFVCETPVIRDAICSLPRKVVKSSGQRIYLTNYDSKDYGHFIARKSALYLCDTKDEALALQAISTEQHRAISASIDAIKAEHAAKIDALIAAPGSAL